MPPGVFGNDPINYTDPITAETIDGATTYYVRDPRGGLLAQRSPSGTHYYRFDGQGSVTGLLDTGGNVVATYGYDPFGQLTSMTGGTMATSNPWRYVGAFQDGTGLYKMGHRYYDPSLGRWTQQDPIFDPLDPKQWNRYIYVGNDPTNFTDPTGLSWWDPRDWNWDCIATAAAIVMGVVFVATGLFSVVSAAIGEVALVGGSAGLLAWGALNYVGGVATINSAAYESRRLGC